MIMKLPSNQLEAFYSVAKTLSFSKGADLIHVTQSAVSQRISLLEEYLGSSLFIRDRSQLKLTGLGLKLLRHCQLQVQSEAEFLSETSRSGLGSELSGQIRIGGFSSIMRSAVIPALTQMLQANPHLGLTLITEELSDLLAVLKQSQVDFVVSNKNPDKEDIECIHMGIEENVLVKSSKHKDNDIYLDHDEQDVTTTMYFKLLKKSDRKIKKRYLDDVYGLIDGVRNGLGKAVLPQHLIEKDKNFKVIYPEIVLKIDLYLLYYKQPFYSRLHEQVKHSLIDYFERNFSLK